MATGEILDREMTDAEHEQYILDSKATEITQAAADAKAAARLSGLAKLAALGLTENEIRALVG